MDFERAIETQRLKLLRVVAGLVVLVGVLSLGPVSRGFSVSICSFVGAMLSRAETAARYLVIAQARLLAVRGGMAVEQIQFSEFLARAFVADETGISLPDCRERLKALLAVLMNLPRHAARLIRRIEKQMRGMARTSQLLPRFDQGQPVARRFWTVLTTRIERPPDKSLPASLSFTSLRNSDGRYRRLDHHQDRFSISRACCGFNESGFRAKCRTKPDHHVHGKRNLNQRHNPAITAGSACDFWGCDNDGCTSGRYIIKTGDTLDPPTSRRQPSIVRVECAGCSVVE